MLRLNSNGSNNESSRTRILDNHEDNEDLTGQQRRKVTLDPGQLDDLLNFSDEEESDFEQELSRQGSLDSILSQESIHPKDKESSPSKQKGHQRRHSLTVCETPTFACQNQSSVKPRKPPKLVLETQMSNMSSSTAMSSGSATPTSDPGTPKLEETEEQQCPLASDSIAQMQARLHAEFLQSVSNFSYFCQIHVKDILKLAKAKILAIIKT